MYELNDENGGVDVLQKRNALVEWVKGCEHTVVDLPKTQEFGSEYGNNQNEDYERSEMDSGDYRFQDGLANNRPHIEVVKWSE
jgi:hypothetical protein